MKNTDLLIPVYLNQRMVFDLLAIYEDGFSMLTKVETSKNQSNESEKQASGEIGASNIFAFLKLKLDGKYSKRGADDTGENRSQEKTHTPTSLLSKLRTRMQDDGILKFYPGTDMNSVQIGDFVEVSSTLEISPLIALLESMIKAAQLADAFESAGQQKGKKRVSSNDATIAQMNALLKDLRNGEMVDLIAPLSESEFTGLLPIYLSYLVNNNLKELGGVTLRVLGKITQHLPSVDSDETISLFRNTTFNLLKNKKLTQFLNGLDQLNGRDLEIPEVYTHIKAPAFLMTPIAIYS